MLELRKKLPRPAWTPARTPSTGTFSITTRSPWPGPRSTPSDSPATAAKAARNPFEAELRRRHIVQKNSRPNHPTTCGKAERFQQTMKKWLRAQPVQPSTIAELQTLLDQFRDEYNHRRPHRSLPHRATPATAYNARPKATPGTDRDHDTHDRVRHDKINKAGTVTLRVAGRLRHIGIGRTYAGTYVILLVQDLNVSVVHAATGELLRELTIDPTPRLPTHRQTTRTHHKEAAGPTKT